MCRVNTCCLCVDVERGSLIIAITGIVLSALQLLSNAGHIDYAGIGGGVLGLIAAIILLIGVKMRKSILVLIYLILILIVIILEVLAFVSVLINVIDRGDFLNALGGLVLYGLQIGLIIYFAIVVYSFYCSLKEGGTAGMGMRNV